MILFTVVTIKSIKLRYKLLYKLQFLQKEVKPDFCFF